MSRPRKLSVRIVDCVTVARWANSSMTFKEYHSDRPSKAVTLQIESPYDLLYIEEQIAKIRAEWKRQLERA